LLLLSLLQTRRDWPGGVPAERLDISQRTARRDIGFPIRATRGPDGGYRVAAGTQLPPLLFDDDEAVALVIALRTAVTTGAGIEDAATRALTTLGQVLPKRLRARIDALDLTAIPRTGNCANPQADTSVLLAIGAATSAVGAAV
jgi:predicted DNA-binding transcriptional regulator YafY